MVDGTKMIDILRLLVEFSLCTNQLKSVHFKKTVAHFIESTTTLKGMSIAQLSSWNKWTLVIGFFPKIDKRSYIFFIIKLLSQIRSWSWEKWLEIIKCASTSQRFFHVLNSCPEPDYILFIAIVWLLLTVMSRAVDCLGY